jgi:predicted GTPase
MGLKPRSPETRKRVIIMGAAGRDFHNFLAYYRNRPEYEVVAFTATQIPGISHRTFPKSMTGRFYRKAIPIYPESELTELIKRLKVDEVVFSYSDVSNRYISERRRLVKRHGASFLILEPDKTMLKSSRPVISVCAVRTGSGKSPTTRKVARALSDMGLRVVVVRHPMPYGNLKRQSVQRFKTARDLGRHKCTIEEREEYEGHIKEGVVVYAGVDYEKILRRAEKEADVIIWDGGNNDFPFFRPDLSIVIADARRPGHELSYYHGTVNVRMADYVIINKVKTAKSRDVERVASNVRRLNPKATILRANMTKLADKPELIEGKKVLVVEDGPTLTHGGLSIGAGYLAAVKYKASKIIDPRPYAVGSIRKVFKEFRHLREVLPAMGYGKSQMTELQRTINKADCDSVVIGTPVDLGRYIKIKKPLTNVVYDIHLIGKPTIKDIVERFVKKESRIRTRR